MRCKAITTKKQQCRLSARPGRNVCHLHAKMVDRGQEMKMVEEDRPVPQEPETPVLDPVMECQCCYGELPANNRSTSISCTKKCNTHRFCHDCIRGYIDSHLTEGNASTTCMLDASEKCGGVYRTRSLQKILEPDKFEKLSEQMQLTRIKQLAATLDHFHICPFCQRYGVQVPDVKHTREAMCGTCHHGWCLKCRQESHPPHIPCEKLRQLDHDFVRCKVEELISDALMHTCPSCHTKYIKEDGCNLMTCPHCHSYSCYLCGIGLKRRNGTKYWHFKGHSDAGADAKCRLYCNNDFKNGNQVYNTARLKNVCGRLFESNPEQEARDMIRTCLTDLGYQEFIPAVAAASWWRRIFCCWA